MGDFFHSLHDTMVFDPRDWSLITSDAWLYGIIVGWSAEALMVVAKEHLWSNEACERLQQFHLDYVNRCKHEQ